MTQAGILREVLVRLGVSSTTAYYTDAILEAWTDQAHRWAVAYKRWPFTEGKVETTYATTPEAKLYPEGWRSDSIRLLQVGGKRMQKLNFEDYQIYREDNATGKDKVFSDFVQEYYVNPNIDESGTTTMWGQYTPALLTLNTLFTDREEEGNEAIINEMVSYAMMRERKTNEALTYHKKAQDILEGVWKRIKDEQFAYHGKNRGMFERLDVLKGAMNDEVIKRDQFI